MPFTSALDSHASVEAVLEKSGLGLNATLFLSDRGSLKGELFRAEFEIATVLSGWLSLPAVLRLSDLPRPCIVFRTTGQPETAPLRTTVGRNGVALRVPGMEQFLSAGGGARWAALMINPDALRSRYEALGHGKLDLAVALPRFFTPRPDDLAHLVGLHDQLMSNLTARSDLPTVERLAAERPLASAIVEAAAACLDDRASVSSVVRRRHAEILIRLREAVEEKPADALTINDLCARLSVSNRTLHAVCLEHFGMGPKRYLTLRRLGNSRRALLAAREGGNVTEIALRSGFWELGRFAGAYKLAFGESPSETLRRVM